jgi:molecular chaperone GrpE
MSENDHVEAPNNLPTEAEEQLEVEKRRAEEYFSKLKYLQADFENLRKRCDRQIEQANLYANERLILPLLDVMDELELAVMNAQTTDSAPVLIEGVKMTLKRLRKVLEQEGVTAIESKDALFDPTKHNAISAEQRSDVENCIVIEEVRKGYMMKEKVIRPAIVRVAVKKESQSRNKEENKE